MSHLVLLGILLSSASARIWSSDKLQELASRQEEPSRISFKECNLDLESRLDCGFYGIGLEECYSRGCCWEALNTSALPWCYHSKPTITDKCMAGDNERSDCGYVGIRKEQCLASQCCWQPSNNFGQPWCYYRQIEWPAECGKQAVQPNLHGSRIVGGEEAKPHSWPWQASMDLAGYGHFCGASIINSRWLLTAAHCESGFYRGEISVVVGAHGLHDNDTETPQKIVVVDRYAHEAYDHSTIDKDVMLLKLAEPITFSDNVSPICLPEAKAHPRPGQHCYTTGWGTLTLFGEHPEYLQQVMLPYITEEMCKQWYSEMGVPSVTPNMLCAGYEEGGRSGCHGDSGGPFVCYEDDHWELHGVVSWGGPCGYERVASVFARVSQFTDWIEKIMAENQK